MFGFEQCNQSKIFEAGERLKNLTNVVMQQDDECSMPCKMIYLELINIPSQENWQTVRTFTFYINHINTMIRSELSYTMMSYIGEFGGWIGLFVGGSLPDVFQILIDGLWQLRNLSI